MKNRRAERSERELQYIRIASLVEAQNAPRQGVREIQFLTVTCREDGV